MYCIDVQRELDRLAGFYAEAQAVCELPDEVLFRPAPEVSGWSAGHHLFHISLANELAMRNVRMIVGGGSPFVKEQVEPSLFGHLLMVWGSMPRGVGQAPRAVYPPERPDPRIVRDAFAQNRTDLAPWLEQAGAIAGARGSIRHKQLGALGAAQWLRFAGIHGWHHLAIMHEVLEA
jgi:hypothetical protein